MYINGAYSHSSCTVYIIMPKCKQSHSDFIAQDRSTQIYLKLQYFTRIGEIAKSEVNIYKICEIIRYMKTVLDRTITN